MVKIVEPPGDGFNNSPSSGMVEFSLIGNWEGSLEGMVLCVGYFKKYFTPVTWKLVIHVFKWVCVQDKLGFGFS